MTNKTDEVPGKYDTDSPEIKEQAEQLLKDYYKGEKAAETEQTPNKLPKRPSLLTWKLYPNGVIVLVDGASGRKLEFTPKEAQEAQDKASAEVQAEDAEQAALDAEAEADEAEAQALVAEQKAKAAREKANKTPFAYIDKAAKSQGPKGATNAANAKRAAEAEAKAKAKAEAEAKAKAAAAKAKAGE